MTQNISSPLTINRPQTYGYEYLSSIYLMKDVNVNASSDKILYYLPAKAVLSACLAIDGYVNVVGCKVDPHWIHINEENSLITERLIRIYQNLDLPLVLNWGIWAKVLSLFELREKLSQFDLADIYGMPETEIPEIFKEIEQRYPIRFTHSIAEEAIQVLLHISE